MHMTVLRRVGGSVMLAVPPALLDLLNLQAGSTVGIALDGNRLVIEPPPRRRYSLDELLAQCDTGAALPDSVGMMALSWPTGRERL
jgi:antitoxin ChpS